MLSIWRWGVIGSFTVFLMGFSLTAAAVEPAPVEPAAAAESAPPAATSAPASQLAAAPARHENFFSAEELAALEDKPPVFGQARQGVLNGDLDIDSGQLSYSKTSAHASHVHFAPGNESSSSYGGSLRVGYNLRFSDSASWWPHLGVYGWHVHEQQSGPYGAVTSTARTSVAFGSHDIEAFGVSLYAPVLFHPATHFFIGIGPSFYVDLVESVDSFSNARRFWGVSSTVGGWI